LINKLIIYEEHSLSRAFLFAGVYTNYAAHIHIYLIGKSQNGLD